MEFVNLPLVFLIGCALLWITYEALNGGSFSRQQG